MGVSPKLYLTSGLTKRLVSSTTRPFLNLAGAMEVEPVCVPIAAPGTLAGPVLGDVSAAAAVIGEFYGFFDVYAFRLEPGGNKENWPG